MKIKLNVLIYIIITTLNVTFKFNGVTVKPILKYILSLLWIAYTIPYIFKKKKENKIAKIHFKYAIIPLAAMFIYTIFLWITGISRVENIRYVTRLISTVGYLGICILYACISYIVLGKKIIDYTWYSLIISYFFGSICMAFFGSPVDTLRYMFTLKDTVQITKIFEVHDLTFAMGFFLIYFVYFGKKENIKHLYSKIIISILYVIWGYKRIEFAAIAITFILFIFIGRKRKELSFKTTVITGVVLAVSLIYVFLASSGLLSILAEKYNVNFMGRLYTYEFMTRYFEFKPTFIGHGLSYVDKLIEELRTRGTLYKGWMLLSGMHSDTLKKYIELGFIGFIVWIIYVIKIKTIKFKNEFSDKVAAIYLMFTVYSFVLYLTDNVFEYYIFTLIYVIIPLAMSEITDNTIKKVGD